MSSLFVIFAVNIHTQMELQFKPVNKLFEQSIRENWERNALSNYRGVTLTYADVAKRVKYLHGFFSECGLERGDKIAICAKNQVNWGVCFIATLTYGAVAVPILPDFKADNIHYLVNHSDAKILFVDEYIWENLSERSMPNLSLIIQISTFGCLYATDKALMEARNSKGDNFDELFTEALAPEDIDYYEDKPEELAMINYTSGTSGFSKGVMLPYRSLYMNIVFARDYALPQINCESEAVSMLPMAHMYGLMFEFLFEFCDGAHIHFLTRVPSPKVILGACAEIHPDIIMAVPLVIEKVYKSRLKPALEKNEVYLKLPLFSQGIQKKIRNELIEAFGGRFEEVILGGAPLNPEVENFLHKIHFPFTVGYGMTECGPIITYIKWYRGKLGSSGKEVPGCHIRVVSPDPCNIPGEVQVSGDNVFLGYYKNEAATKEVFTEDGWFRTGDIGVIDEDGYLFLRGRSKCMILGPSGQNIYPEELEAVINNVSYVVESLVIEDNGGLTALIYPDYHQGELDNMTREQLEAKILSVLPELNKMLPAYAQIRKIEFMPEDFERTPKRSIKRYLYQRS